MKRYKNRAYFFLAEVFLVFLTILPSALVAQTCPPNANSVIVSNPNTYYPSTNANLNQGAVSIVLAAAESGTTPIQSGDILLIIQMQGAEINSANSKRYGDGVSGNPSSGYLDNTELMAGNMEYIVATNSVPLTGGTLNLLSGLGHNYKNADYGTTGVYRYQIIRVNTYYNLKLNSTITAPNWNGRTGGVIALNIMQTLDLNGQTITAAGAGFRGGAGRQLGGSSGGDNSDRRTLSSKNFNGSKGEGIAGTPRFLNNQGSFLDLGSSIEGYPNGSYASGAPGNAGGGGTDGNPSNNDQNSGGGGGGNGGSGGKGGNSWSSDLETGGDGGSAFEQRSGSRLVLGGGGGAGTTNNGTGTGSAGFSSSGAAGGGIIILIATQISGQGTINVNGTSANSSVSNDSNGGGGAGGSVLIYAGSGHSNITVTATGGEGGSNTGGGSPHGPGGGGGGGVIYSNAPLHAATVSSAGAAGITAGNIHYGASSGVSGIITQNITPSQIPSHMLYCSVLPSQISNAMVVVRYPGAEVLWDALNEMNVTGYTIEKSFDGNHFIYAGTTQVKLISVTPNHYSFFDPETGDRSRPVFYRIKQHLSNGSFIYSRIVYLNAERSADNIWVRYKSVGQPTSLHFISEGSSVVTLQLIGSNGLIAWKKKLRAKAGINEFSIDEINRSPNGIYRLVYSDKSKNEALGIMISH